jgi:hypothetical protein
VEDHRRRNEFGQVGETDEDEADEKDVQAKGVSAATLKSTVIGNKKVVPERESQKKAVESKKTK